MEYEAFVDAQLVSLVRFATALCADTGVGEDIVHDVLLRLMGRWEHVADHPAPEAYVRRAVVNEYLSWRRKWARIVPHASVPEISRVVGDHADAQATRSELAGELAVLPARQRAVLVMRYYGGMSDDDIASTLGCRPTTVRSHASRALATLRVDLTKQRLLAQLEDDRAYGS